MTLARLSPNCIQSPRQGFKLLIFLFKFPSAPIMWVLTQAIIISDHDGLLTGFSVLSPFNPSSAQGNIHNRSNHTKTNVRPMVQARYPPCRHLLNHSGSPGRRARDQGCSSPTIQITGMANLAEVQPALTLARIHSPNYKAHHITPPESPSVGSPQHVR